MARKSKFDRVETVIENDKSLRVVIYTRISVDRDTEQSIRNQTRECIEYAKAHGYIVVGEPFIDRGKSAYKLETVRPGFDAAMQTIESGKANHLLVWKLDRMTRNARGFGKINERLEKSGATFGSVMEPWFDTSSAIGYALIGLMAALAQLEAEGMQGRALSWHEGRLAELMPPTGNRPFGYNRDKGANTLTVNADEKELVVEMAQRILGGDALREIARDFTSRNIPTSQCNAKRQTNTNWSHTTIRSVLLNPTSAALVEVAKGEYLPSPNWQPLLDVDMWEAVGQVLTDPDRTSHIDGGTDARKLKHLLPGLMACGKCGGRMVTQIHKAGRQYGCADCDMSIMAEMADANVTRWIMENVSESDWSLLRAAGKGSATAEEIQGRINELFIERTLNPNRVPKAVYESAVSALEDQLAAAKEDCATPMPDVPNLHEGWADMSNHDKRTVIGAVIERIEVAPYRKGCTGDKRIAIVGMNR